MKHARLGLFVFAVFFLPPEVFSARIVKENFTSQGVKRTYYLFVPDAITENTPAPLVVLLHGSGRNGLSLVDKWQDLAKKESLILAGPDALNSQGWQVPGDGPDFLHELVEMLESRCPIDRRRVYLFGHSAGAIQALQMALMEPGYFAAVAVHAGALPPESTVLMERDARKIPIALFVGTNDAYFPLSVVRATRDALNSHGYSAQLTEIKGHTHWYYDRAPEINRNAWDFLKKVQLDGEPWFDQIIFGNPRQ